MSAAPTTLGAFLKDLRWRLDDVRQMLMTENSYGRLYGCDEWSTPVVNLATAIKVIDAAALESKAEPTLRDTFAAASLARIIDGVRPAAEIARMAYQLADLMLIERSKP